MRETQVLNDKKELEYKLREKAKAGELKAVATVPSAAGEKKKRRWDQTQTPLATNENSEQTWHEATTPHALNTMSAKDMETPMHNRVWDPTPGHAEPGATTPPDLTLSETPKVKGMYLLVIQNLFRKL